MALEIQALLPSCPMHGVAVLCRRRPVAARNLQESDVRKDLAMATWCKEVDPVMREFQPL